LAVTIRFGNDCKARGFLLDRKNVALLGGALVLLDEASTRNGVPTEEGD